MVAPLSCLRIGGAGHRCPEEHKNIRILQTLEAQCRMLVFYVVFETHIQTFHYKP